MGHYKANTRDILFNMYEMPETHAPTDSELYSDYDEETTRTIIAEVANLAEGPLAETYRDFDDNPPQFDPTTFSVTLPDCVKKTHRTLMDAGFYQMDLPASLGGAEAPPSLRWAIAEMILGANPAAYLYMAGPLFAAVLDGIGNQQQKRLAEIMVEKEWGATMVLTEPDAGSDVGAGRTVAHQQPDGSWLLDGVKRFITSGDHDLSDNIIHFVLARPVGVEGAGGPGTKGLSLFIVPKFLFDPQSGELGERNGAFVTNIEHKMGLTASTTCEIVFGQNGTPAKGWLVGDRHTGIADMFLIIQWARMMVGTKSMAQLSAAYHTALDYSRTRLQGADLAAGGNKNAPRVPIISHPDVRRMLLTQKAYAEGLRALVMYASAWQNEFELVTAGEREGDAAGIHGIIDLLLPVVKGAGSERAGESLVLSMQTLGGSGYLRDYPIELEIRDHAIDRLYEGVTHIQALELLVRKILKDEMKAWNHVMNSVISTMQSGPDDLAHTRQHVLEAAADTQAMLDSLTGYAIGSLSDPKEIYKLGENANRFLMAVGDLLVGWLLTRQAHEAASRIAEANEADKAFYEGKIETAKFFARNILPRLASDRLVIVTASDSSIMSMREESF